MERSAWGAFPCKHTLRGCSPQKRQEGPWGAGELRWGRWGTQREGMCTGSTLEKGQVLVTDRKPFFLVLRQ